MDIKFLFLFFCCCKKRKNGFFPYFIPSPYPYPSIYIHIMLYQSNIYISFSYLPFRLPSSFSKQTHRAMSGSRIIYTSRYSCISCCVIKMKAIGTEQKKTKRINKWVCTEKEWNECGSFRTNPNRIKRGAQDEGLSLHPRRRHLNTLKLKEIWLLLLVWGWGL